MILLLFYLQMLLKRLDTILWQPLNTNHSQKWLLSQGQIQLLNRSKQQLKYLMLVGVHVDLYVRFWLTLICYRRHWSKLCTVASILIPNWWSLSIWQHSGCGKKWICSWKENLYPGSWHEQWIWYHEKSGWSNTPWAVLQINARYYIRFTS